MVDSKEYSLDRRELLAWASVLGPAFLAANGGSVAGAADPQTAKQPPAKRYQMKKSINQWAFPYPDRMNLRECLQLAKDAGYTIVDKRITRDEVYIADEAFFTGTAAEVTPVRELDNRSIGSGVRGPVTEQLQSMFFDIANGRNDKYSHWLTYINE